MQSTDEASVAAYAEYVERPSSATAEEAERTAAEAQARLERAAGILARAAIRIAGRAEGGESQPQT